jgi:hypothetical protein
LISRLSEKSAFGSVAKTFSWENLLLDRFGNSDIIEKFPSCALDASSFFDSADAAVWADHTMDAKSGALMDDTVWLTGLAIRASEKD